MDGYLDHASTTPMRPEAVQAMLPFLAEDFANPSGAHAPARYAQRAVDEAREVMAEVLGVRPGEVVFTGSGTEADNAAVFGRHDLVGGTMVCSAIEHHAVLDAVLARKGRVVAVHPDGVIDLDRLAAGLDPTVTLVSVMLVNNEVGTLQPLAQVVECVRSSCPDAVIHTDAVQAMPWLDVAELACTVDLISVSAHKFGGPKGVGALVVRDGVALAARLVGGGQERERRSGTLNVAGIAAMAVAARMTAQTRGQTTARIGPLRDRLTEGLLAAITEACETVRRPELGDGPAPERTAGICHLCIEGVESEALLYLLEQGGVFASAASSCASGAMEPSHVLAAMGVPRSLALGSLRLSLGAASTDRDVDLALDVIPAAVERLRRFTRRSA